MANEPAESDVRQEVQQRLLAHGLKCVHPEWLAQCDWYGVVTSAATAQNYWECFDIFADLLPDAEYATTVRQLWVNIDGLPPDEADRRLRKHGRHISREMWMTKKGKRIYDRLPDTVTIYRGCVDGRERSWSWTLCSNHAEHFARGLSHDDSQKRLVTGTVRKDDIFALFGADSEEGETSGGNWEEGEVVVPYELVAVMHIEVLQ